MPRPLRLETSNNVSTPTLSRPVRVCLTVLFKRIDLEEVQFV